MAAPLQNCSDFLKFYFKIHFKRACQVLLFSLDVVVSVELRVHCGENEGAVGFIYRVHSLYFVKNPYNPYMISCTDFRKSVHKIRTSVHKIRTSGFKSVHMLFKFYLFFTCHSCIWKVMSLEPYIFSQDIGWKKTVIWFSMKKRYEFCLNRV